MALTLKINTVNRIADVEYGTVRARQGISGTSSLDFKLKDATGPEIGDTAELADGATILWTGTVVGVRTDGNAPMKRYASVTANNTTQPAFTAAPWNLSDSPNGSTTFAYGDLEVEEAQGDGEVETRISLKTWTNGLTAGMTIALTNVLHGYSATEFTISEIATTYSRTDKPVYDLTLGNARVPLSAWVEGEIDAEFPIDGTKITDGAITTPKLAANAVTALNIEAGAVTADKLAATLVLASLIQAPAATGRRVEIDGAGIRLYDSDESLLVNIPTNTDPVYVQGQILADSLVSQSTAEFRGTASLNTNAVMTVQSAVAPPSSAPVVTASLDYLTLTSTPSNLGHGIYRDAAAGTYWLGADPTAGTAVAHEYNATTGAFVRSITRTGSTTTYTTTLGATSHISDSAQATSGSGDSQVATPLTFPSNGYPKRATKVSVWMAGYTGDQSCKVAIWNTSGTKLASSAAFTAVQRTFSNGNSNQYNQALTSELSVSDGQTVWAGFLRTTATPGFWWDKDDGSFTTKRADGLDGNMTGIATDTNAKPNVFITYEYDVDTAVEKAKIVGVASDGTSVVAVLGADGIMHRYNRSDLTYLSATDLSAQIGGTEANAGLTYDGTNFVVTTATGTTGTDQVRLVKVTTAGVYSSTLNTTGFAINGSTATIRGGYYDATNMWVCVNGQARKYTYSTGAYVSNNEFGSSASMLNGLAYDGTVFRGWAVASPTKVWAFTTWDWTTESAVYWVAYTWYDQAGTTHETTISPRASLTMRRRERLQAVTPAIPTGGADDPDRCRVYMNRGAGDPGIGGMKLQVTDTATARYLTTFASGGAADPGSNNFPAGTAGELRSAVALSSGWSLTGNGRMKYAPMGAIATRTSTQSLTNNTWTALQFSATDISDPFGFHDPASSNTRFTVPTGWGGTYLLVGNATFDANATGIRRLGWAKNGAANPNDEDMMAIWPATALTAQMAVSAVLELSAGDYVELMGLQNSGGSLNVLANARGAVYYLGETA